MYFTKSQRKRSCDKATNRICEMEQAWMLRIQANEIGLPQEPDSFIRLLLLVVFHFSEICIDDFRVVARFA